MTGFKLVDVTHKELVAELLNGQSTLSLATTSADGSPRVAPLFYFPGDDLQLYWLSSASSVHSRNLKRNPAAAIAIYRPAAGWKEIRGVQMRGAVSIVLDRSERGGIVAAYCARFRLGPLFHARIARSKLYRFRPEWVRYLDNSVCAGYKFEFALEGAAE